MNLLYFLAFVIVAALLVSCTRHNSSRVETQHTKGPTLEQRVRSLEQWGNAEKPKYSEEEMRQQGQADRAEIQRLDLVDRAAQDFLSRVPNATITNWSIGSVWNTNHIGCDLQYTVLGSAEILYKGFGYTSKIGTNWDLIWEMEPKR